MKRLGLDLAEIGIFEPAYTSEVKNLPRYVPHPVHYDQRAREAPGLANTSAAKVRGSHILRMRETKPGEVEADTAGLTGTPGYTNHIAARSLNTLCLSIIYELALKSI